MRRHERSYRGACPFTVHRTASDNLPVYVVKQKNRTEDVTVIRKLRGDSEALKRELEPLGAAFEARAAKVLVPNTGHLWQERLPATGWEPRPRGKEIQVGNHRRAIVGYLKGIGY